MRFSSIKYLAFTLVVALGITALSRGDRAPVIPKVWDDAELAVMEVPLAAGFTRAPVSSDHYYRIPAQPTYKSYPVYHPDKEPPGYMEWLKQQEPEIIFDPGRLTSEADWIKAGEVIYDTPIFTGAAMVAEMRNPEWYKKTNVPLAKDGVLPFVRYVIKKKGEVVAGQGACASCHTRVMPDGLVIKGAQGNVPFYRMGKPPAGIDEKQFLERMRMATRLSWSTPWLQPDPNARLETLSMAELMSGVESIPPGVVARLHTSLVYPPQVPDLIGLKDRRYFDHTGIARHRTIGDLMRYAAAITSAEAVMYRYGDFIPGDKLPDLPRLGRLSDEQLYALALYLYSLTPPPNPNAFDARAARGQKVFERERCAECHAPPLYTNNKLMPVEGFKVPEEHWKKYDVMTTTIGTDPNLALKTRKGTGYYKVPSLKGVWYRGPFEHNGSVATLEDWFDPRRINANYVPTGFRGWGVKTRAIKGHPYGLKLSEEDRQALIAFLKTL